MISTSHEQFQNALQPTATNFSAWVQGGGGVQQSSVQNTFQNQQQPLQQFQYQQFTQPQHQTSRQLVAPYSIQDRVICQQHQQGVDPFLQDEVSTDRIFQKTVVDESWEASPAKRARPNRAEDLRVFTGAAEPSAPAMEDSESSCPTSCPLDVGLKSGVRANTYFPGTATLLQPASLAWLDAHSCSDSASPTSIAACDSASMDMF